MFNGGWGGCRNSIIDDVCCVVDLLWTSDFLPNYHSISGSGSGGGNNVISCLIVLDAIGVFVIFCSIMGKV